MAMAELVIIALNLQLFMYFFLIKGLPLLNSLVFTVCGVTLVHYFLLVYARSILPVGAIIVLLIFIPFVHHRKNFIRKENRQSLLPESLFLLFTLLVIFTVPNSLRFVIWDELSAWAYRTKWLFYNKTLWLGDQMESFPFYPPIQNILHITYSRSSSFSEPATLRIQMLLIFLLLGATFVNSRYTSRVVAFGAILIALSAPYLFGFVYSTVVPDLLLSLIVLFAFSIALDHDALEKNLVGLLFLTSFMTLLKPTGLFFSIIFCVFFLFRFGTREIRSFFIVSIFNFMVAFTWQLYIVQNQIQNDSFTFMGIVQRISGGLFSRNNVSSVKESGLQEFAVDSKPVLMKMIRDFLDGTIVFSIPFFLFVLICLLWKKFPLKYLYYGIFVFVSYELLVLVTYLFLMSGYEANNTASHSRYIATLLLPFSMLLIRRILGVVPKFQANLLVVALVTLSLFQSNNLLSEAKNRQPYPDAVSLRNDAMQKYMSSKIPSGSRIMYVEQNAPSLGYSRLLFSFSALPSLVQTGCWSFGDPYYQGDIWTCHGSIRPRLERVDYLFVNSADSKFYAVLDFEKINYDAVLTTGVYEVKQKYASISLVSLGNR